MEELKEMLKNRPELTTVYFNEKNEWQFFKAIGFDKAVSREELLKEEVEQKQSKKD